jgi:hypothetical protein
MIPDAAFSSGPSAIPLLGRIGITKTGVNIYSGFEAGFGVGAAPFPCEDLDQDGDQDGYCAPGLNVNECETGLHNACGAEYVNTGLFMDDCGGHASPYHLHAAPQSLQEQCCWSDSGSGHGALVGVALDGHGMYSKRETTNTTPVLDACNGHWGVTPDSNGKVVYHYHFTDTAPNTLGCYGPVQSMEEALSLYDGCSPTRSILFDPRFKWRK